MVGGTIFHREVIQREISRVLVLNLSGETKRCLKHRQDKFVLDTAFALIEGHPRFRVLWNDRVGTSHKPT